MTVGAWVRRILFGRPHIAVVDMQWGEDTKDFVTTTIPELWAHSRAGAAAKAVAIAQDGVETGWSLIVVGISP